MPTTPNKTLAIIDDDTELRDESPGRSAPLPGDDAARATPAPSGAAGRPAVGRRPRPRPGRRPTASSCCGSWTATGAPRHPGGRALLGQRLRRPSSTAHRAGASEYVDQAVLLPRTSGPSSTRLVSGPQAPRRRPAQAGRPARRQRPGHAGGRLDSALARQHDDGGRLGEVLVAEGLVSEQDIITAVAGQMRIGVVDLTQATPQPAALGLLPRDFIVRHRLMPLSLDDGGSLVVGDDQPARRHLHRRGRHAHQEARGAGHLHRGGFDEAVAIYFSSRGKLKDARDERRRAGAPPPGRSTPTSSRSSTPCSPTPPAWTRRTSTSSRPRTPCTCAAASTACCTSCGSSPRSCRPASSAASRSWATSTSPSGGCRRTGARASSSPAARPSTCASPPSPAMYGENLAIRILEVSPLPPTLAVARAHRRQPRPLRGGAQGARGRHRHRAAPPARASRRRCTPRSS